LRTRFPSSSIRFRITIKCYIFVWQPDDDIPIPVSIQKTSWLSAIHPRTNNNCLKNMRFIFILTGMATLLCTSGLQAQNKRPPLYVNVLAAYSEATNGYDYGNTKSGYAVGMAAGVIIKGFHFVEGEVLNLNYKWKRSGDSGGLAFLPVLASYRINGPIGDDWSVQMGVSVGGAREKITCSRPDYDYTYSSDKWVVAYGGLAGASCKFGRHISAGFDFRIIWTMKSDFDTSESADPVAHGMLTYYISFRY
jgi:hypothetical protein